MTVAGRTVRNVNRMTICTGALIAGAPFPGETLTPGSSPVCGAAIAIPAVKATAIRMMNHRGI
jgi:hypothetical protein